MMLYKSSKVYIKCLASIGNSLISSYNCYLRVLEKISVQPYISLLMKSLIHFNTCYCCVLADGADSAPGSRTKNKKMVVSSGLQMVWLSSGCHFWSGYAILFMFLNTALYWVFGSKNPFRCHLLVFDYFATRK